MAEKKKQAKLIYFVRHSKEVFLIFLHRTQASLLDYSEFPLNSVSSCQCSFKILSFSLLQPGLCRRLKGEVRAEAVRLSGKACAHSKV